MKHLKKFENLDMLRQWGRLLSDEDFDNYAYEFDLIVEPFLEYADIGYELSFETAYGTRVRISYDDYKERNDTYKEFIHGLPTGRFFFKSYITINYDYNVLLSLLEDIQACVGRLGDRGWTLKEFNVIGQKVPIFGKPNITISHEFEKGNRG